jgi:hypothetical protein
MAITGLALVTARVLSWMCPMDSIDLSTVVRVGSTGGNCMQCCTYCIRSKLEALEISGSKGYGGSLLVLHSGAMLSFAKCPSLFNIRHRVVLQHNGCYIWASQPFP